MFVQENLTTTPYEVPGVSWELPAELETKFYQFGAFAKLVLDEGRSRVVDVVEDCAKRAEAEAAAKIDAAEQAERLALRAEKARKAALEAQGVSTLARVMFRSAAPSMRADEVIQCRALAEEWTPGVYQAGDVRGADGVPFRCVQAHDSRGQDGWGPGQAPALWAAFHGTTKAAALPWVAPTGAHDLYRAGECMVWTDGRTLRAVEDTSFSPEDAPDKWEEVSA